MRRHAIVPEVFSYSAAFSVCDKRVPVVGTHCAAVSACEMGQQRQQASYLLRALQSQAIMPVCG